MPLNTRYTAGEAADVLARTGAPLLVAAGEFLGADKTADLDRDALPDLRHIVRVPIDKDDGTWDEFVAARHRSRRRRRQRRRGEARRRLRHPVHLRHHRPQQGRAVRAPAVARRARGVGGVRAGDQCRPLPLHQPVLPQLRLQGRHPGMPADGGDADPAAHVRSGEGDGRGGRAPDHRAAWAADDLPDAARPPQARRLRPQLAAVRGHRRGDDPGGADRADAVRAGHRHRADGVRADRGKRVRHDVPRRRRRRHRRHHLRTPDRRIRAADRRPRRGRRRRGAAARTERDARLSRRPRGDRQRPSTPTAGCTPATSAGSTRPGT